MMAYSQLTFAQRCKIQAFWQAGYLQKDIAIEVGVHASTISREIRRNQRWNGKYVPEQAQSFYDHRRRNSKRPLTFTTEVQFAVTLMLLDDWSPEQISGFAKKEGLFLISHERIYQFILEDKNAGGKLYTHLRHGKKRYRKRGSGKHPGSIKNRVMIDERPIEVDNKERLGDWEIDTIIGCGHKQAIVTLVERVSKKTLIGMVGTKKSDFVTNQTIRLLSPLSDYVLTITADNGSEFAGHEKIAKALGAKIYFAHPYHSWERGLNENTNGLIRQYIPKGKDFSTVTEEDILMIQDKLNNRPRKSLNYATPNEVFDQLKQTG